MAYAPSKASDADARLDRTPCKLYVKTFCTVTTSLGIASAASQRGKTHVTAQTTDSTLPPRCSSCSFATAR